MLQIKNLNKRYKKNHVLRDINLEIKGHGVFALLGLNGAGKTTLISILCGIVRSDSGEILYKGEPFSKLFKKDKSLCSLTPQNLAFYPTLSVKDNLKFFSKLNSLPSQKQQKMVDFAIHISRLENYLLIKADNLSGGLKRRLNLAIGLLNDPKILFLDEPTVGIDPQSRTFILKAIKELSQNGRLVFYTSHYMNEVDFLADEVAIIDKGKILTSFSKVNDNSILTIEVDKDLTSQTLAILNRFTHFSRVSNTLFSDEFSYDKFLDFIDYTKKHGLEFLKISLSPSSVESKFLSLTGEGLRDV